MHDFQEMTNVTWNYFLTDERLPVGTSLVPKSYVTKNKHDEGWIIIPPPEYLESAEKYEKFKDIMCDIMIDFNVKISKTNK